MTRPATVIRLVIALAVLGASSIAVSGQTYITGEAAILEAVNSAPTWVGWPMRTVMQLGTLPAGVVIVLLVMRATARRDLMPTAATSLSVLLGFGLDDVMKAIIQRPRPPAVLHELAVRQPISGFGFPSGHTTMAFAIATALQPVLPRRWRGVAWALAVIVALARMYVGVHWPADLVGGAALGIAVASTAWLLISACGRSSDRHPLRP